MLKFVMACFIILFFNACGMETSSSDLNIKKIISDTDTGDTGSDDNTTIDDNTTTIDDNTSIEEPTDVETNSIFDTDGAIEDIYACIVGTSDGYTKHIVSDTSPDPVGIFDEEYGVGVNSRYPNDPDIRKTNVTVFYYDLLPVRSMEVISIYEDDFRVTVDTAWAVNDEPKVYAMTPVDSNGLFGCYRYDLSSIDTNSTVIGTKVYRNRDN